MILEIPTLLSRFLKEGPVEGPTQVACVRTTRPKYLVFGVDATRPAYVVQFGSEEELSRLHSVMSTLHAKLPDIVPQSLVCEPWRCKEFVHVQAGLAGTPWFRLCERLGSSETRARLQGRSSKVLARLHTAVRNSPEWVRRVRPAEELRHQAALCLERDIRFSEKADDCVADYAEALEALGEMFWFAQHGDFCLNNLLVSESGIAVIDFDEFGRTFMPLQDEIGLALSFRHFVPTAARLLPPLEDIKAFLPEFSPGEIDLSEWLPGLILHHLLWRINQAHGFPGREVARQSLIAMVEEFAATSEYLAPRSARGGRPDRKVASP